MQRYRFLEIFQENPDGSLTPKRKIKVGGTVLGPQTSLKPGVIFNGGVDFHKYKYLDMAAEPRGDVLEIKGFYKS